MTPGTLVVAGTLPPDMTEVEIEYCVPCGFRNRALDVQQALLSGLERELDAVSLVMGDHGVFQVRADGEVIYDKETDTLDVDDIVREIRSR
jgi:selenoprotein W-related protein